MFSDTGGVLLLPFCNTGVILVTLVLLLELLLVTRLLIAIIIIFMSSSYENLTKFYVTNTWCCFCY